MATDIELAWAAGFFDGEGCINIIQRFAKYKNREGGKKYHSVSLIVYQINKDPLIKFQEMFGGVIRYRDTRRADGIKARPAYIWTAYTKSARDALQQMLPYLVVKRQEASLVLSLDFSSGKVSEEEWDKRNSVQAFLRDYHASYTWEERQGWLK